MDTDGHTAVPRGTRDENLDPGSWSCDDVAQFLEINEIKCDPLVEAIIEQVSFCFVFMNSFLMKFIFYSRKNFFLRLISVLIGISPTLIFCILFLLESKLK